MRAPILLAAAVERQSPFQLFSLWFLLFIVVVLLVKIIIEPADHITIERRIAYPDHLRFINRFIGTYLLGISPINPLAHDLVFECFLSAERQVVPDIDIDFYAAQREEVIQYIYQRYG